MKKFFLLMSVILTLMPLMAAPGESLLEPMPFDWVNGNEQEAGDTVWYQVDLSGIAAGDNVLLYMTNLTEFNATVTTAAQLRNGTEFPDATNTRVLSPYKNAAMELPHSLINLLGEKKIVYVKLFSDQKIKFSAEPVEPGEKDLDCLSAAEFVWTGTTHNAGKNWYKINLSSVMSNPKKTVEITIKNQGSAAATVKGGISMDCPSTGTMDRTFSLSAGDQSVMTVKRSQLNMLSADEFYIRLESDQKLLLSAREVDALAADEVKAEDPIEFNLNTTYTLGDNKTQWYKINVADLAALSKALEVILENTSSATASIDAHLQYTVISSDYMTRSISLSAGDKVTKEIARNLITSASAQTDTAYLRLKTTKAIAFSAQVKGAACLNAEALVIGTDKAHAASAEAKWYAIDIKEAKADVAHDLQVTITNNGAAAASVTAQVAFECPCESTTDLTRTIAAGGSLSKVLQNGLYSSLATDTIWVGVTSNQNVTIAADKVPVDPTFTPITECASATAFALGTSYAVADTSWFEVTISDVLADPTKLPEVKVENTGAATATVKVEVAFVCPITSPMQSRTIKVAAGGEYVKQLTTDMLSSLNPSITTAYVRVTTDQPITFVADLKIDPANACASATLFDWDGTTHVAGTTTWYKIDGLAPIVADPTKTVDITIENKGAATATIIGGLSLDCPSTGTMDRTITLAAGAQRVYSLNRSQLSMLGANEIYIRVESDQELWITAQEQTLPTTDITVVDAIDFQLDSTYTVAAGATQWYKINMNDVDSARQLLEVTIENTAAAASTIDAVLQYERIATEEEYLTRSLTLGAAQVYVKDITRNLIETVHNNTDTAFVRLTATEAITFSARFKTRSEGTACLKAKPFDKTGTYQAGSETVTWYAIDITEEKKDALHDMQITVENRSAALATVSAQIAFDCPCATTTDLTRTLAAGASTSKTLLYSTYANLATDTIWVGITTDQNIMMSAQPVAAEAFTPITACDAAEYFKLDTLYTQTADTAWYVALLSELLVEEYKVPELSITNNGSATANVKVEVAFTCPVTSAMQSRNITIAAGATYTKKPTLDMLNSIDPTIDSVFIRIISNQSISAIATLKYENEGKGCETATTFDWVNGNDHAANDTVWYAVDVTEAKAQGKGVVVTVKNLEDAAATIRVDLSMDCPTTGLTTYNGTLAASATQSKTLAPSMIAGVGGTVYVCVASTKALHLSADTISVPADPEETDACLNAEEFKWNYTYTHAATDTVWYKASVKDLRDGHNVPHIYVTNTDSKTIKVTAEFTFDCAQATTPKTMTFSTGQAWDKLMEQNLIDGLDPTVDSAYVKLYGDGSFEFRVENQDPNQGQDCLHAIPFDWVNGNIHIEGDSLWYVIQLADTLAVETRDLRINVKNLDTTKPVNAKFDILTDCKRAQNDILIENETATLAAGASTSRTISNDILKGYAEIKIGLKTDADVHITAEFVSTVRQEFFATRDTIFGGVCLADPAGYTYTVADSTRNYFVADDRATWTWTDTVTFNHSEIELADSIVTFNIIPIQNPTVVFTDTATLAAPTLVEGRVIDLSATTADILAKYAAARAAIPSPYCDTIAEVTSIEWQMQSPDKGTWGPVPTTTRIAFGTKVLAFHYRFVTDCSKGRYTSAIRFNVKEGLNLDMGTTVDTVCAGTSYDLASGKSVVINVDTTMTDIIFVANYSADEDAQRVYKYEIKVWKDLVLPLGLESNIHPQAGLPLDMTAAEKALKDALDAQLAADPQVVPYTSATWEILDGSDYVSIPTTPIAADVTSITVRYKVVTECGDTTSTPVTIPVASVAQHTVTVLDTLCAGDTYVSRLQTVTVNVDTTFIDVVSTTLPSTQTVDSIYTYDLKVWKTLTLPDVSALITPQVGVVLDVADADAELRKQFADQKTADDLVVAWSNITWEWLNPATGAFESPLPTEPLAEATDITLHYIVTTACGDTTSTDMVIALGAKLVAETTIIDTVCVGTEYSTRESLVTINADTTFSQTVEFDYLPTQKGDSTYHYDIKVWKALTLPDVSASISAQVGAVIDMAALATADAAVRADLTGQNTADDLVVAWSNITWEWLNPATGVFEALPTAVLTDATVTLHYIVTTACGDVTSADMVITLGAKLVAETTITDTVCVGTEYKTRTSLVTITADTQFDETVEFDYSPTQKGDSIYHYDIKVFVPVTLPASLTENELPQAICGQPLHTTEATAALEALLNNSLTDINSGITTITWEVLVNGAWVDATTLTTIPALSEEELTVRYIVITSCDDQLISGDLVLTVETPTADNTTEYANMPAVSKYDGWLLMVNLNEINARGFYPTAEQVTWIKIVGEADFATTDASDPVDEEVATGYYYTTGEKLTGAYYAVIDMEPVQEDLCGATLRSVTITCTSEATPVSIAPSMVAPGEDVVISGLNPAETYTLDIYNLTGVLVESREVTGVATYTIKAQDVTGYYMLNVKDAIESTTLRYIVK